MCFAFSPLPLKSSLCQIIVIFNIFLHIYYKETGVDTEMCCPKGKCGCQYFILLTLKKEFK